MSLVKNYIIDPLREMILKSIIQFRESCSPEFLDFMAGLFGDLLAIMTVSMVVVFIFNLVRTCNYYRKTRR